MRVFSLILAFLFLSYLLPGEVLRSYSENAAFKAAAHDVIQTLPSSESLAARTLHTPANKFQPFLVAISCQPVTKRGVIVWSREVRRELGNDFSLTTQRTRAPPV